MLRRCPKIQSGEAARTPATDLRSGITLDSVKVVQEAPGIARDASGPLVTQEVVGVVPFPLVSTGTDANVQVRGVSPDVLRIRTFAKIVQGRMFDPGVSELVAGKNVRSTSHGSSVRSGDGRSRRTASRDRCGPSTGRCFPS